MGLFTRIKTNNNKVIQIYCGGDSMETYELGDSVPYFSDPEKSFSVCFADGAYNGLCEDENDDNQYWVIIKNSRIETVFCQSNIVFERDEYKSLHEDTLDFLIKKYNLPPVVEFSNFSTPPSPMPYALLIKSILNKPLTQS